MIQFNIWNDAIPDKEEISAKNFQKEELKSIIVFSEKKN